MESTIAHATRFRRCAEVSFRGSEYSTRGGTSGKVCRSTMPSASSARSRSDSVRGLIPLSERSSSQKRLRPSARSRITRIVHFPQMISAVAQTGQVGSAIFAEDTARLQEMK
jgi:hypothetical protein